MHEAVQIYDKNTKATVSPRDLEANLLLKAAAKLQSIKDDWTRAKDELDHALLYNRKLWTIFASSVMEEDAQPLPQSIRENIASLGIFIFKRTIDIQTAPTPEKLTALIDINRNIAAGLRS